ncbi:hypothetical protein [Sphaerisporangium fuscum]|uniref:hypothetical protein n=1 Tax=Sphaerisporangium fuscum TaxID=2835868 RepID=UPI001BDC4506|nr:hypothetical protein [Sphaerisporangium fuscum]
MHELLDPLNDELDGRVLVNLTSGTSQGARETAEWVARRGGAYLDGAILATPQAVGADAVILHSGPRRPSTCTSRLCGASARARRTSVRTTACRHCTTWPS